MKVDKRKVRNKCYIALKQARKLYSIDKELANHTVKTILFVIKKYN